jgi:hypothetical protein
MEDEANCTGRSQWVKEGQGISGIGQSCASA